ncbi:MAG: hypothetical protein U0R51_07275 [Solirubrobacterales bacterium]
MSDEGTTPQHHDPVGDEAASAPALASEISRRVGAILDAVEREATRLREEARSDANRYLDDARRQADALVAERRQRIAELSDELVAKSEAVVSRLDDAEPVRGGFENLVRALGDAAERLAEEADPEAPVPAVPPAAPPMPAAPAYEPAPGATPATTFAPPPPAPRPEYATPYPPSAPAPPAQPAAQPVAPPPEPARPAAAGSFREQPHPARAPAPAGFAQPRGTTWRELDDARVVAIRMASGGSTRSEVGDHLQRNMGVADPSRTLDEVFGQGSGDGERVPWTGTDG